MNEFTLIDRYFSPLAEGFPGAEGLRDDAALLAPPKGMEIVATTDTMNEGVHFIGDEPPGDLAKKLLRVNLSDLAAKGAQPWCYLLNLGLPQGCGEAWVADFARGLAEDQQRYGLHLAGGDSTNTRGGISLSVTAFGLVEKGKIVRRSGAKPGDLLYVTGTIGDAHLGLKAARGELEASEEDTAYFLSAYRLPDPPVACARELGGLASAAMDISDGLAQDLGHLCAASGVGARVNARDVPLSEAARRQNVELGALLTGGDDYQLLLAIPPGREVVQGTRLTRIGSITEEKCVEFLGANDAPMALDVTGWQHRF